MSLDTEPFTSMSNNKEESNNDETSDFDGDLNYAKIGYFHFDDNQSSDFQAREMKSVFVDVTTQYLKLVLYQPYQNKMNIFDQVGLVSV